MKKSISNPLTLASVIALGCPTVALADISALDVWDAWKSYSESLGQTITVGSQEASGGALVLHDVKMGFEFPEGNVASTLSLLEFRERGDGTVAITMAPDMPVSMSAKPENGEAVDLAVIMRQTGMSIIASGDPDDIAFDYLASDFSFTVDTLVVDGETIDADISLALAGIDGKFAISRADGTSYTSQMAAENTTYDIGFTDPDNGGRLVMSGTIADLQSKSDVVIPEGFDSTDPTQIFGSAFSMVGGLTTGASESNSSFQEGSDSFSATSTAANSSLNFAIDGGAMEYGGAAKGVDYVIQSPQIPFPEITLGFSEVAFNFLMPLSKSDDPQDYSFLMRFADLEISDMIWGMFDPGQIMPRDPATISLDLSGQMNWLVEITDPEQAEAFGGETPAELHGLTINEILVSALGAEVNATGAFTFDNTDLETFDGMPAPTGKIDANIIGVNGLLDRLIQMGLLPDDQAMGARMMLGLFARPGYGEDILTSTIEVNGDGSVFANGQQLK